MAGYDQNSIIVPVPTVTSSSASMAMPITIPPSEAMSSALVTISGLGAETISFETSPDSMNGAPANPLIYKTDWQGQQLQYSTARTNLWVQSTSLTSAPNANAGCPVAPVVTTAPDGTTSGVYSLTPGVTDAFHSFYQTITFAGDQRSQTWYLKPNGLNYAHVLVGGGNTIGINLTTGAVFNPSGATAVVALMPNGWIKVVATGTPGAGASPAGIYPFNTQSALVSWTGDGVNGILAWHPQNETGPIGTSDIPTAASAATVTDYTLANSIVTFAVAPLKDAILSYGLTQSERIFGFGDGTTQAFYIDRGKWGTLTANATKGNGIYQIDLRGAVGLRMTKSGSADTATVNMTLKRDALQYKNTAGTWTVT